MSDDKPQGFATRSLHAGAKPDPTTNARVTPIYQTTAFTFNDTDHAANLFGLAEFGNIYTRIMNPTTDVLEQRMASLEGGTAALAVASGHAAQLVAFHALMEPGDEIVASDKLYGGSINQLGHSFKNFGWGVAWADADDPASFAAAITPKTKAIFIESLANPGGVVLDIAAIAKIAKDAHIPLIVDNTLATPYLCRPFEHGANIVIHSLTKFIGGHGNSMGGVIIDGGNFDWAKDDRFPMIAADRPEYGGANLHAAMGPMSFAIACRVLSLRDLGPALSPFNAFLILTGSETLPLRMKKHCENALTIAKYLKGHDKVEGVSYAALEDDPYHALQQKYMPLGGGAVLTFRLTGGYEAGVKFVESLELFSHLANIGDTRSLVIHPASTTHRQLSDEQREAAGAGNSVVRLSVGIEDAQDLIDDLEQALS